MIFSFKKFVVVGFGSFHTILLFMVGELEGVRVFGYWHLTDER